MPVYVWDDLSQRMVEKGELMARRANAAPDLRNPDLAIPGVISDTMPPVQSMLDGKMYDSKATLRATYREAGVTEVGNDPSVTNPKPFKRPPPDRQAIRDSLKRAYSQVNLTSNEAPGTANLG